MNGTVTGVTVRTKRNEKEQSPLADFARRRWSPLGDSFLGEALSDAYFT